MDKVQKVKRQSLHTVERLRFDQNIEGSQNMPDFLELVMIASNEDWSFPPGNHVNIWSINREWVEMKVTRSHLSRVKTALRQAGFEDGGKQIEGLQNTPNVRDIFSRAGTTCLVLNSLNKWGANQNGSLSASNKPFLTRTLLCLLYDDPGFTHGAPKSMTRFQYRAQALAGRSAEEITSADEE